MAEETAIAPATEPAKPAASAPAAPPAEPAKAAPAKPAAEEPEEPEAAEEDDEVLSVSKEELEAIKKDPVLKKLYRGMTKGHEARRQALAAERAQMSQERELLDAIRENPLEAAKVIAQAAGLQVLDKPKPVDETVDAITTKLTAVVGADIAKAFKPILEEAIDERVKNLIGPIRAETEEIAHRTIAAQSEAAVTQFKSRHPNEITPAIEAKMVELTKLYQPSEDVDEQTYLDGILTMATAGKGKAQVTKEVVERMRTAAETAEPSGGVSAGKVEAALDFKGKSFDQAFDAAWEAAKAKRASS